MSVTVVMGVDEYSTLIGRVKKGVEICRSNSELFKEWMKSTESNESFFLRPWKKKTHWRVFQEEAHYWWVEEYIRDFHEGTPECRSLFDFFGGKAWLCIPNWRRLEDLVDRYPEMVEGHAAQVFIEQDTLKRINVFINKFRGEI